MLSSKRFSSQRTVAAHSSLGLKSTSLSMHIKTFCHRITQDADARRLRTDSTLMH
jgi:hypothetical protein